MIKQILKTEEWEVELPCKMEVSNYKEFSHYKTRVLMKYNSEKEYPFTTGLGDVFKYARPIKPPKLVDWEFEDFQKAFNDNIVFSDRHFEFRIDGLGKDKKGIRIIDKWKGLEFCLKYWKLQDGSPLKKEMK